MAKMRMLSCLMPAAAAFAMMAAWSGEAAAEPIDYSVQAVATGLLGTTQFGNQLVTITVVADTGGVTEVAAGVYTNTGIGTVSIANGPSANFTDVLSAFVNGPDALGIADVPASHDVLDAIVPGGSYNLAANIGPVSGQPEFNQSFAFATSDGDFELTAVDSASTFSAMESEIPEPASAWLLAAGFAALPALRRHGRPR